MSYRPDITPENTLWVGAWWIGFLGAGAASLLISIPILGYPQRLPGTWHREAGAVFASSYSWGHQGSGGGQVSSVQIVIKILFAPLGSPAAYFPALLLEPSSWGWRRVLCCFCLLQFPVLVASHVLFVSISLLFAGSQRYIVMRVSEAHQLKDGSHKKASDPDFGKTVKDLPR